MIDGFEDLFVLIIEDDLVNSNILRILLTHSMKLSQIEEWPDSGQFLEKMKAFSRKPDLIIMDITITPIDGFEMITQLRSDPEFDDIKVIAYTAGVMQDQVQKMKSLKFDGLISKPITRDIFPQLVGRIMSGEPIWYIS